MPIIRLLEPGEVPTALITTTEIPAADSGTGVMGVSTYAARADHAHPEGTEVPASVLSVTNPVAPGTANPGISTKVAREDHVHPEQPLSRSNTNPLTAGTATPGTSLILTREDHVHPLPFLDGVVGTSDAKTIRTNLGALGDYNKNNLEFGDLSTAGSRYIDFHSSGNSVDYDSRILGNGGTTTTGGGNLSYVAANHTFNGLIIPETTKGIKGSVAGDNAQSGSVGEYIVVSTGSSVAMAHGSLIDVLAFNLPAGDWDISASALITAGGGGTNTSSSPQIFLSPTYNYRNLINAQFATVPANTPTVGMGIPSHRYNTTTVTTVTLRAYIAITAGSFVVTAEIRARRAR